MRSTKVKLFEFQLAINESRFCAENSVSKSQKRFYCDVKMCEVFNQISKAMLFYQQPYPSLESIMFKERLLKC